MSCTSGADDRAGSTTTTDAGATTITSAPSAEGARPSTGCTTRGDTPSGTAIEHRTITVDGVDRSYDVASPAAPAGVEVPAPLVLSFHGHGGSAASHEASTDIAAEGTAAGSVVVLPDGTGTPLTWETSGTGTDAAFIEALVDQVADTACIDLARVYLSGLSAGAAFAIAYTCNHEDQVAALGAVTVDFQLGCTEPTSIVAFHGTEDRSVPYQDGAIGLSLPGFPVRGTELNMADWADLAGCGEPTKTPVTPQVTHWVFAGCTAGAEVELFSIDSGPHEWPRAEAATDELGEQDLDATNEILAFFARHHR